MEYPIILFPDFVSVYDESLVFCDVDVSCISLIMHTSLKNILIDTSDPDFRFRKMCVNFAFYDITGD